MKRLMILLLVLAFGFGGAACSQQQAALPAAGEGADTPTGSPSAETNMETAPVVTEAPAEQYKVETCSFEDYVGDISFSWDGITTEGEAAAIAATLLEQFQAKGYFRDFRLQILRHDPEAGIWIAVFWPDPLMPGADFVIAFRESDLQIVGMWVGE